MTKQEAINILVQVTRQIQATADVHDQIKEALLVVNNLVEPVEKSDEKKKKE